MACGDTSTSRIVVFSWSDICRLRRSMVRSLVRYFFYVAHFHRRVSGEVLVGSDTNIVIVGGKSLGPPSSLGQAEHLSCFKVVS